MKKTALPVIVSVLLSIAYAQAQTAPNQANIWYFNFNCGIDFTSGTPVSLNNGALYTNEGCTSICDSNSNLLFYSDGVTVYNANHTMMVNGFGLNGGGSTSQSCIAVRQPGSNTIWYLFTCASDGGAAGGQYSIIDMSLQAGLGEVTVKNVPLVTSVDEKLTATAQSNGVDYWILFHGFSDNTFYAYPLTSAGVGSQVSSNAGSTGGFYVGCMKFSPDGTKIAEAKYSLHSFQLFDFDNTTGIVTYGFTFPLGNGFYSYGVEWSRDSRHLFMGNVDYYPGQIYEADMTLPDSTAIVASLSLIGNAANELWGSLQMAPDGKIYVVRYSFSYLGVINNPDSLGAACDYVSNGFSVAPHTNYLGLPNYCSSWFAVNTLNAENTCFGDSTHFFINGAVADSLVEWNFGDPASGAANTTTGYDVYHVFTAMDTFNVTIIEYSMGGNVDTIYSTVIIASLPLINLGNDTTVCIGDTLVLDAGNAGASFSWSNGSGAQTIAVTDSGTYAVTVSNSGCKNTDNITVSFIDCTLLPTPGVFVDDPTICEKFCLDFHDQSTNNPTSWLWQFPGGAPSTATQQDPTNICYNTPGLYDVILTATNAFGSFTQTFPDFVTVYATPTAPTINQAGYTLYASFGTSYQWQFNSVDIFGATNQSYTVTQSGYYTVIVSDQHGCTNYTSVYILISGIDGGNGSQEISVYPNPATDGLMVEWLNGSAGDEISISLINTLGQEVYSSEEKISSSNRKKKIDLQEISAGIYFIEIKTQNVFTHSDFISMKKKIIIMK